MSREFVLAGSFDRVGPKVSPNRGTCHGRKVDWDHDIQARKICFLRHGKRDLCFSFVVLKMCENVHNAINLGLHVSYSTVRSVIVQHVTSSML
jgi:hypothetical protein